MRSREARARPWLNNSVLRGRSAVAGVRVSKDAPLLSCSPLSLPLSLVSSPALPVSVPRVLVSPSASKIPVLVRRGVATSMGKEGVREKVKSLALSSPVSRIPVRVKDLSAGCRPVSVQVRPSGPLVAQAGVPLAKAVDKVVASSVSSGGPPELSSAEMRARASALFASLTAAAPVGSGGSSGCSAPVSCRKIVGERMSIRRCINPMPIRSHRLGQPVKSILKLRVRPVDETDPRCLTLPAGHGVIPDPVARKSVTIDFLPDTPARAWTGADAPGWRCSLCGGDRHRDGCARHQEDLPSQLSGEEWLKYQLERGYDYLAMSGGLLSTTGYDPLARLDDQCF